MATVYEYEVELIYEVNGEKYNRTFRQWAYSPADAAMQSLMALGAELPDAVSAAKILRVGPPADVIERASRSEQETLARAVTTMVQQLTKSKV